MATDTLVHAARLVDVARFTDEGLSTETSGRSVRARETSVAVSDDGIATLQHAAVNDNRRAAPLGDPALRATPSTS